jgi:subtilisin family serine protease
MKNIILIITVHLLVGFQIVVAQPTPHDSIDVILTFTTPAAAATLKAEVNATEWGYTKPSEARLWRIKKGTPCKKMDGSTILINSATDVIGAVSGRPEAAGVSDNPIVQALPTMIRITKNPQNNVPPLTTCATSCLLPQKKLITTQRNNVRIYVFDTGIELNGNNRVRSPHLSPYVDLTNAYNFVDNNNNAHDNHIKGHGTIVSNLIALSLMKLKFGTSAVPPVKIVPIKILDHEGKGWTFDLIKAFDKATNENADLINCSLILKAAGFDKNPLQIAIEKAKAKQILVISGAGNTNENLDTVPYFPAGLPSTNQITVGASTCSRQKASFSNYGLRNTDLFALGENLLTLGRGDSLATVSGTSFAAPLVTGYAAILSARLNVRNETTVKTNVMASIDVIPLLSTLCVSKGVLNVCRNTTLAKEIVTNEVESFTKNWNVFPNPCTTQANIQFTLESPNWIYIKIFNSFGTEIQTIAHQFYEAGTHMQSFEIKVLPVGMYFAVFQNGDLFETRKIEVVK